MSNCSVYIIGWDKQGPIKFGIAARPVHRLANLQSSCPYRLRIFKAWVFLDSDRASMIEAACLKARGSDALIGEWAQLTAKQAIIIAECAISEQNFVWRVWEPKQSELIARKRVLSDIKIHPDEIREAKALDEYRYLRRDLA